MLKQVRVFLIYTRFISVDAAQRMTLFHTSKEPAPRACSRIPLVNPLASIETIGSFAAVQTQYGRIQGSKTLVRDSEE